ncbi:uncharacterized protein LOC125319373 [Corvus hawaiiensis]|uniref:uncharacterized protein LOC125319373 n=1 Tax=Corvus hawaiiensis TaxID=134902 RepID=UPI002018DDC6|nr:uncharacterized protein LOC125319373 [Corvus hawaiiensis]
MDLEFAAAQKLLLSILAKQGEEVKEKDLNKLVLWTWEHGQLRVPPFLFNAAEWREVGDHLWDCTIRGKGKEMTNLGPTWRTVINTLKNMQAESKVAAAAVEAIATPAGVVAPAQTTQRGGLSGLFKSPSVIKRQKAEKHFETVSELLREQEKELLQSEPKEEVTATMPQSKLKANTEVTVDQSMSGATGGPSCQPRLYPACPPPPLPTEIHPEPQTVPLPDDDIPMTEATNEVPAHPPGSCVNPQALERWAHQVEEAMHQMKPHFDCALSSMEEKLNWKHEPQQGATESRKGVAQTALQLQEWAQVEPSAPPPIVTHNSHIKLQATPGVQICYKDPRMGQWGGAAPLLFNGRGYSCVSTDTGPIWVPSRWTKPAPSPAVDKSDSSECMTN